MVIKKNFYLFVFLILATMVQTSHILGMGHAHKTLPFLRRAVCWMPVAATAVYSTLDAQGKSMNTNVQQQKHNQKPSNKTAGCMMLAHGLGDKAQNFLGYVRSSNLVESDSLYAIQFNEQTTDLGQERDCALLNNAIQTKATEHDGRVKLFGASRGAATVLNWSGLVQSDKRLVSTIIAEAPFATVSDVAQHWVKNNVKSSNSFFDSILEGSRLASTTPSIQNAVIKFSQYPNYNPNGPQPVKSIAQGIHPTLLIAHRHDPTVPRDSTYTLYMQACKAGRQNVHYFEVNDHRHIGALNRPEVPLVIHAFWKYYGDTHNPQLAAQGQKLFQATQPACENEQGLLNE